ncbi:MAG: TOBE domain-containing protein [Anaerotignum sp.]|nr:TOBE domain-containing protein [Anaerotignum sp.]
MDGAKVFLSDDKQANLAKKDVQPQSVTLGVRPEHLLLKGDAGQMIKGKVDVSEMMGSAIHLLVDACGQDSIMIVQMNDIHDENLNFSIGAPVSFTFRGKNVNIFDKETELNLEF